MKSKFGTKRTCLSCQEHFFDMNRVPFACPKCGREMTPDELWKTRGIAARGRKKELEDIVLDTGVEGMDDGVVGDDLAILEDTSDLDGGDDLMRGYGGGESEDEE